MCRLCGSWSVVGYNHRKVIGKDLIRADLHGMGLALCGNVSAETTCEEGDQDTETDTKTDRQTDVTKYITSHIRGW